MPDSSGAPVRDETQIAFRIALRCSLLTVALAVAFPLFHLTGDVALRPAFSAGFRLASVFVSLFLSGSAVREARKLGRSDSLAFLSSVFFYGTTVFLLYAFQIGRLLVQAFSSDPVGLSQWASSLAGVERFTTANVLFALLAGQVPYLAYYFTLSWMLGRKAP